MKTITKVVAVLMLVAVFATLMTACGKPKNHIDENLIGTWTQTDDKGSWTWTFNKDGTCKLEGSDGFSSDGTYLIEEEGIGKIKINLDKWDKEKLFTYSATGKVIDLESFDVNYYCMKQ